MDSKTCLVGDVFTTTFWGVPEVCIIAGKFNGKIHFIRLESIRRRKGIKKDFCVALLDVGLFDKIQKTFIHHSEWYSEYRHQQPVP